MDMIEWAAIGFSVAAFLCGGAGACGVFVMLFKSGRGIQAILGRIDVLDLKVEVVKDAVNGPLNRKIDSVVKANEETRKRGERIQADFSKRAEMCASHETGLKFIQDTLQELKVHMSCRGEE